MIFEPPYIAVVFTSTRTAGDDGYGDMSNHMADLVNDVDGFLGMDSVRGADGRGITVGYFRDDEALKNWRENLEHREAMQLGRVKWYDEYSLHITRVERSYTWSREE